MPSLSYCQALWPGFFLSQFFVEQGIYLVIFTRKVDTASNIWRIQSHMTALQSHTLWLSVTCYLYLLPVPNTCTCSCYLLPVPVTCIFLCNVSPDKMRRTDLYMAIDSAHIADLFTQVFST